MNPNQELHDLGQSIWIDSITREMVGSGTLQQLHRRARRDRA